MGAEEIFEGANLRPPHRQCINSQLIWGASEGQGLLTRGRQPPAGYATGTVYLIMVTHSNVMFSDIVNSCYLVVCQISTP